MARCLGRVSAVGLGRSPTSIATGLAFGVGDDLLADPLEVVELLAGLVKAATITTSPAQPRRTTRPTRPDSRPSRRQASPLSPRHPPLPPRSPLACSSLDDGPAAAPERSAMYIGLWTNERSTLRWVRLVPCTPNGPSRCPSLCERSVYEHVNLICLGRKSPALVSCEL